MRIARDNGETIRSSFLRYIRNSYKEVNDWCGVDLIYRMVFSFLDSNTNNSFHQISSLEMALIGIPKYGGKGEEEIKYFSDFNGFLDTLLAFNTWGEFLSKSFY
jgi:hypothetical protein